MTLAERFVSVFRLPYAVGCFLVGFLLFGLVNAFLAQYTGPGGGFATAVSATLSWQYLSQDALFAYAFYAPRYMRVKLLEASASVERLLPDGHDGIRRAFAGISSPRPQIVTWVLFLAALLVALNVSAILGGPSSFVIDSGSAFSPLEFFSSILQIITIALVTLGLSSVVWSYYSITRGIRRFSSAPLQLRPYYEDAFLGLRPIGSLALSVATAYFGLIALFLLSLLTSATAPDPGEVLGVGSFLFGLIVLGVLNFFRPLMNLHRRMIAEKRAAKAALYPLLRTVFEGTSNPRSADMTDLFRANLMDQKVASMAIWPYDVGILGRLSVIAASVTAILISRIIALFLHV